MSISARPEGEPLTHTPAPSHPREGDQLIGLDEALMKSFSMTTNPVAAAAVMRGTPERAEIFPFTTISQRRVSLGSV